MSEIGPVGPSIPLQSDSHGVKFLGKLSPGDIVEGHVVKADSSGVVVNFRGTSVIVSGNVSAQAGESVIAEVIQNGDELLLKLLPSATSGSDSAALPGQQGVGENLGATLRNLGVEMTPQTLAAATELVKAGIPVTAETVNGLAMLLYGTSSLGEQMGQLASLLAGLVGDLGKDYAARVLERFPVQLAQVLLGSDVEALANEIASYLRDSGIFAEAKLAALLGRGSEGALETILARDLKWLMLKLRGEMRENSALRALLTETGQLSEFQERNQTILDMITGQQIQNLRFPHETYLFFELPLPEETGLEKARVEFFFKRRRSGEPVDPKNVTVAIRVNTSRLGALNSLLTVVNGILSCQFSAGRDEVSDMVNARAGELKEAFEKTAFVVSDISCRTRATQERPDAPVEPAKPPASSRVDLKA